MGIENWMMRGKGTAHGSKLLIVSFFHLISNFPRCASFWSHALMVSQEIAQKRKWGRIRGMMHNIRRRRKEVEKVGFDLLSHLQRASMASRSRKSWSLVTEEMSMGNWASKQDESQKSVLRWNQKIQPLALKNTHPLKHPPTTFRPTISPHTALMKS